MIKILRDFKMTLTLAAVIAILLVAESAGASVWQSSMTW
jgi:hypothetical protein